MSDLASKLTGIALFDPSAFGRAAGRGVTPECFKEPMERLIWEAADKLLKEGITPSAEALIFKAGVPTGCVVLRCDSSETHLEDAATKAVLAARDAEQIERLSEGLGAAFAASDFSALDEKIRKLAEVSERAARDKGGPLADLEARRISLRTPVDRPEDRILLAGKVVATPGNLCCLIARAKVGKTAVVGAVVAAIVEAAYGAREADTFQFTAADPKGRAVLLIDTEQSLYDAQLCLRRALERAGKTEEPEWLFCYTLNGCDPEQMQAQIRMAADHAAAKCGGIFAIVIDGVADLVADVNDLRETTPAVRRLQRLAMRHDAPLICVIHSNESQQAGDDARGHLGKQLCRKAESNLVLKKVGAVVTITSEKQRRAPITEADGVALSWSDELNRHASCVSPSASKEAVEREALAELARELFAGNATLRYSEMRRLIMEREGCKEKTAEARIQRMVRFGLIRKTLLNHYELCP